MNHFDACLFWIMREQRGLRQGDIAKVSGWKLVRMVASVWGKPTNEVARELIERYDLIESGRRRRKRP